jgi:hypothetical protein
MIRALSLGRSSRDGSHRLPHPFHPLMMTRTRSNGVRRIARCSAGRSSSVQSEVAVAVTSHNPVGRGGHILWSAPANFYGYLSKNAILSTHASLKAA